MAIGCLNGQRRSRGQSPHSTVHILEMVTGFPSQVAGGLSERHKERRFQKGDASLPGPGRSQVLLKLSRDHAGMDIS